MDGQNQGQDQAVSFLTVTELSQKYIRTFDLIGSSTAQLRLQDPSIILTFHKKKLRPTAEWPSQDHPGVRVELGSELRSL